ncbi:hypothetical protein ACIHDR_47245, partial [Nocardia sp. NPDC052278]|uniref:hypothetical protein n=1 Tax=unclassified Nocardia TaxID=2637762 RepID=UPI0036AEE5A8
AGRRGVISGAARWMVDLNQAARRAREWPLTVDIETAALWLVTRISQVTSLRCEDLRALWHNHIRECAR